MGTKTVDEAGAGTGTETKTDEKSVDVTKHDPAAEAEERDADLDETGETEETGQAGDSGAADEKLLPVAARAQPGVGQGAAGIVAVVLGLVSLTGSWVGTVAQARNQMFGQLETAQNADVATMLQQYYGDSWNANALVSGIFALIAMLVGVAVLVRPAFGDPDQVQAPWIKSVAWAGVSVGFIGLVLAALKYSDILLGLPNT
ncbi:hypothetical protein [Streptomyces neyagawaensis]|uniref:hypothetical protein n=1 Tax=Streptomyces neyagawaensis TaxID=42238 RepID=UPI0006E3B8C2|nr:hypothetical protein [Streptomyces neyagawaensis]MCL6737525.1 hypothetical protein [Streptomyces neyagawaensis]MDE1687839.1 hypothetical protein [Streptomyces neyagawaensis]